MLSISLILTTPQAEAVLSRWLGSGVRCSRIEPLQGGMINTALRLTFDQAPFTAVIKLNMDQDSPALQSERFRLDYLKASTQLPIPRVYQYAAADLSLPYSYLLLETIPGVNMIQASLSPEDQATIGRGLADVLIDLHGHTRTTFGRIHEPGIPSWADVFVPELTAMRRHVEDKLSDAVLNDIDASLKAAGIYSKIRGHPRSPTATSGRGMSWWTGEGANGISPVWWTPAVRSLRMWNSNWRIFRCSIRLEHPFLTGIQPAFRSGRATNSDGCSTG